MTTGERIRQRRIELGISQEELASRLGYSHKSSISNIEIGKQKLNQSKIVEIADALDTTPMWIMGWEDGQTVEDVFYEAIKTMTEDERDELKNYIQYIISKRQ